jgi:hypothetical protein
MTEPHIEEKDVPVKAEYAPGVYYNSIPLCRIAATLARAMNLEQPLEAHPPIGWMNEIIKERLGVADRTVMYHADAVPMYIYQKYTQIFAPVLKNTEITVPFLSTVESVTPVAHASMYTGVEPEVHGIKTYIRPVLKFETLYDAFIRQGKRCAIIEMTNASFLHLFKEREMDYFEVPSAKEAVDKARDLIREDRHELISIHVLSYDKCAHHFGPESMIALEAIEEEAALFEQLAGSIRENWAGRHKTLYGYAPDHGQHSIANMKGAHGTVLPEDMNIVHFYGMSR